MSVRDSARRREGRRLVLVDLENVNHGSLRTPDAAMWARCVVEASLGVAPGELVVVGVSTIGGLFLAHEAWPEARVVIRRGLDGADLALVDVLCNEGIPERFDRIAIVSGDGIFAEATARLAHDGVAVTVAGWRGCMSARLRLAAHQTVLLDESDYMEVGVAA